MDGAKSKMMSIGNTNKASQVNWSSTKIVLLP
jgi:hypothetical protein